MKKSLRRNQRIKGPVSTGLNFPKQCVSSRERCFLASFPDRRVDTLPVRRGTKHKLYVWSSQITFAPFEHVTCSGYCDDTSKSVFQCLCLSTQLMSRVKLLHLAEHGGIGMGCMVCMFGAVESIACMV